ncbi:structural maintenance of chromosomes 5 isoform X2 [Leptinotarsa decemlineata]|uniref:structural maintenance of chromosomes 5 isoform X2 n=1 Tax=Leptinotarsa decemlineata TaxID=7539 RepID=UPI003D30D2A9
MFKPGCIRKIEVKNFVTYSHVELYPGPHLNMLIGPNGTGKSTVVAAIILGLGGNPKIVGRGSKVSEYVKHGCDSSTINIYLENEAENQYIKVTREFDVRERTVWKLNNRIVKFENVIECIQNFNIQVNNLCQFLPQDRVQDFAKLNKQELLIETQKALCKFDLIDKQEMLILHRASQKEILESIDTYQKKLQNATEFNSRLEGRVQSFNKKKKFAENIQHIERKIAWTSYEQIRVQLSDIKEDRNKAQEVYDKYKNDMKPMERDINENKKSITELQQSNSSIAQIIRNTESSINMNLEKIDTVKDSIRKFNDDMNSRLAEVEQWDREIENASAKLEEMRQLKSEMFAKCASDTQKKQTLSTELSKLLGHQKNIQDKKDEILQMKQDDALRIQALENESSRLENVRQSRLQHLERLSPDAHVAVNWLRNNKHLFRGEIYEPIMLEVNVLESRHAKYVENVIPLRDRLAFTCVYKDDMNKLIRSLRESQNLSVNVIHSGDSTEGVGKFQPSIAIECLRKYGFYTYVNNLFTAPDPIMHYLCKTYRLHDIPLGDQTTNDLYEQVPQQIRKFFSDKYRFSISFSKYSGEKSTRQIEVFSDGGLSLSLDVVKLDKLRGEILEIRRNIGNYDANCQTLEKQFDTLSEKINIAREKLKDIQQQKQNAQAISVRVENLQKKLLEMNQCKKSPENIKNETSLKKKQLLRSMPSIQDTIKKEMSKLVEHVRKSTLTLKKIDNIRKKIAYLENQLSENKRQCQEAEETLSLVKDRYAEVMSQAKSMLNKAKGMSKGFTPADSGFDEFRPHYNSLSSDIQELNALNEQLQSRIACLNVADDDEMREYEERINEIGNITEEIEKLNSNLKKVTEKIEATKQEWLPPLKTLVSEINLQFATAFERMGCAGEISVCTGDNEQDFSQYGISIKVTYRSGEPLQELNSNVQSGGERAVATAAFMLSLQKLTPVPFRCVDEINQGMDANNERRIFELIVESTCQQTSSQYFLITPKLVPHLKYSQNMCIHIVHNGPFVAQDKKWGFSKLCNYHSTNIG